MSGIAVNDECVKAYDQMKMGHKFKAIVFCINDTMTEIVICKEMETATHEELLAELPEDDVRYVLVDHEFVTADGRPQSKIALITWSPDSGAPIKKKMVYAASLKEFRRVIGELPVLQANDLDDVQDPEALTKLLQK